MENQPQIKFLPSRFLLVITVLILSALACQTLVAAPSSPESPAVTVATPEQVVEPVVDQPTESSPAATRPPSPSRDTDDENAPPVSVAPQFIPPNSLVELYERVSPGVVSIQTISEQGSRSSGSGFVIDNEGHLVTNYHVIEGANELEVNFPDGVKVRGTVLGTDLDSDLAIIKVDVPPEQLHPLPLGSSEQVKVGQVVVAIGNPFGLSGTMTVGIISAKGRVLNSMKAAPGGGIFSAGDIIQTDAAINPGNSGGPLLNLSGEVIGINRAIRTENFSTEGAPINSGIGFAISVDILKRVAPSLIADGFYEYPYLGVSSLSDISLSQQEQWGLPRATGALITNVVSGGPADQGGLEIGDLVIAIDDREVLVFGDLLSYLLVYKGPGDEVSLTLLRNDQQLELTVTLGARP